MTCAPVTSGSFREMPLQAFLKFEGPAVTRDCFLFLSVLHSMSLHCSRPYIRDTLGRARNVLHLGSLSVPSTIVDDEYYELT